jgi:hypothetical protein
MNKSFITANQQKRIYRLNARISSDHSNYLKENIYIYKAAFVEEGEDIKKIFSISSAIN